MSLSYNYPPEYAYPSAPPVYRAFPAPPRLHWAVVLVLSFCSFGIFGMIWMVVQAHWVKKVTKNGRPFAWCLAYLLLIPAAMALVFAGVIVLTLVHATDSESALVSVVILLMQLGGFVLYIVSAFALKGGLEACPIDIPLSGVMTFFFSATYFQYHLHDYSVEGKVAEQLSGFETAAPAAAAESDSPSPSRSQ